MSKKVSLTGDEDIQDIADAMKDFFTVNKGTQVSFGLMSSENTEENSQEDLSLLERMMKASLGEGEDDDDAPIG